MTDTMISRIGDLALVIYDMADALWWLSMWRVVRFTMLLHEIGYAGKHAAKITPAVVSNVETLVGTAKEYGRIKWDVLGSGKGPDMNPFVEMLKAASKVNFGGGANGGKGKGGAGGAGGEGGAAAGAGAGGPTTIILELDGKELGRTVEALLSKRNNLRTVTT